MWWFNMVFKNEKELESFLLKKCKNALEKSQMQVYRIIEKFVREFYADYDPILYERTYKLLSSLVMSEIIQTNKGFEAHVYFNYEGLSYVTGAKPSMLRVLDAAAEGLHGAEDLRVMDGNTGANIWSDPLVELDVKAINILVDMLRAEGIPIK